MKIRFPVLHTVVPRLKATLKRVLKSLNPRSLKILSDDVGHGHILKDAAVGGAREKPEPGDDLGPVVRKPHITAVWAKRLTQAVDVASDCRPPGRMREGDPLAHNLVKGNGGVCLRADRGENGTAATSLPGL